MNETIKDYIAYLKKDRRVWAAAGFTAAAVFLWLLTAPSDRSLSNTVRIYKPGSSGPMIIDAAYEDLFAAYRGKIEQGEKERKELYDVMVRLTSNIRENRENVNGQIEIINDRLEQFMRELDALAQAMNTIGPELPLPQAPRYEGPDGIDIVGFNEPTVGSKPDEPRPLIVSVITPGDFVSAQLLTGVVAPTDGTPFPVLLSLTGAIRGPGGVALDVGDARLVGTAVAAKSESRVYINLSQLSIAHPNGRRTAVKVDGWIVGEDGNRGLPGKLESKLPELILATLGVSTVATLGDRLQDNSKLLIDRHPGLTLSDAQLVGSTAFVDASRVLVDVLRSQYESMVPVVEVLSGREVFAVFSVPAEVAVLEEEINMSRGVPVGYWVPL